MGFGIRIAPGVRISASKRGLRAGIGPRIARVHVGAGRVGVSSGLGPVTYYTGVGSKRRKRSSGSRQPASRQPTASLAQLEAQARRSQRGQEIAQLRQLERNLVTLHLQEFPLATPPVIPPPNPVDGKEVHRQLRREAVRGIPWWRFEQRGEAKRIAAARLPQVIANEVASRQQHHRDLQTEADLCYRKLVANDPATVLSALEAAFEDNQSPAAGVDCTGSTASIVILFGSSDSIPDRKVSQTPSGKPTLHKRSKTEQETLYLTALSSTVLATVKEGFACAPGLDTLVVLVVRRNPAAARALGGLDAIYIGTFRRQRLASLHWPSVDCVEQLLAPDDAKISRRGRTGQVGALDLSGEADLARVMRTLRESLNSASPGGNSVADQAPSRDSKLIQDGQVHHEEEAAALIDRTAPGSRLHDGGLASTQGPTYGSAPPQFSPDGYWWWTGREWIPAAQVKGRVATQPQGDVKRVDSLPEGARSVARSGLHESRRPVFVSAHLCPVCGDRAYSWSPTGPPEHECQACGHTWKPELQIG